MPEIEVHIHTEDDQVHRIDSPDDLRVEEVVRDLVAVLHLPALSWRLYSKNTRRPLDFAKSLRENGVSDGEDLFLSSRTNSNHEQELAVCKHCGAGNAPGSKFCGTCGKPMLGGPKEEGQFALHLYTPTGQKHSVRISRGISIAELIKTLISDLSLPTQNAAGGNIQYSLYDKDASRTLDNNRNLIENGLRDGHHLYIRAIEEAVIKLEVFTPNGERISRSVRQAMSTREFIRSLVKELSLQGGIALFDKDTAKNLDPEKTLAENRVASGHHLHIRIQPNGNVNWLPWAAGAAAVILIGLGIYGILITRPLKLSPSKVSLSAGQVQQFRATGGSLPVTWTVNPEIGSVSDDGLYQAPAVISGKQIVQVNATTATGRRKSGSAEISLEPPIVGPSTLTISPGEANLGAGNSQKFSASANGQQNTVARWSLDPDVGVIAPDGTYTAPTSINAEARVTVRAVDGKASGTALVVLKPLRISLSPSTATLFASKQVTLRATVNGSSTQDVHWVIKGPGYISPNGVYFAPAQVPAEQTVVARAISNVDPTKSASVQIVLKPTVTVSIVPLSAQLSPSGRQQFAAAVVGSTNVAVRWTLVGPGSLSSDGVYTAPTSIPSPQNVQVTATSLAQPNKFATATISLTGLTLEITPASATLRASESQQFHAVLKGGTANLVWRLSGPGSLSSSGVYTAPSVLRRDETAHLMAYTSSDPTKQATAIVQLVAYHGAMKGEIVWAGRVPDNGDFFITGNAVTAGTMGGDPLPKMPVQILLTNKDFMVAEMPSVANGFRLKIHTRKRGNRTVNIGWSVQ